MYLELFNPEESFDESNVISNHDPIDRNKNFTDDGVFSEKIFGKMNGSSEEYSCSCGSLRGKFHQKEICPECETQVIFQKSLITKFGWIDLSEEYSIINPFFFEIISKDIIGKDEMERIISFDPKLDIDGGVIDRSTEESPYIDFGLILFKENFEEILEFYFERSNKKEKIRKQYEFILDNLDKVFISKIPVYSAILRPANIVGDKMTFGEENIWFNQIIYDSEVLKNKKNIEKRSLIVKPIHYEIQILANQVYEKIISILAGKTGFLRNTLLGNRVNWSVRTVISPIATEENYEINEVIYPYLPAVELFKFEIINILSKSVGSYPEAFKIWHEATTSFSPRVYNILKELVDKTEGGLSILLNRNPTISLGSMLFVKIAKIKEKFEDYTLNVSNNILLFLAGDFDGDVLSTFSLKDISYKEHFSRLDPRLMVIDNDTGEFNRNVDLDKDYRLGIATFLS
jgi:DNA-directed RNA polymerase beta' subunit